MPVKQQPCEHCTDPDGAACFPVYGLGPHTHAYDAAGQVLPGSTVALPAEPTNYRENPEEPGHGVWWCPHCEDGKPSALSS